MRNTARWAITLGLTATAVCAPLSGAALAAPGDAPSALYAPSALVLTVGKGVSATTATPERAVTLTCAPGPSGTHPAAGSACADLGAVGGDLHLPGGAIEQAHLQVRFQLLHLLGDAGAAAAQALGRAGEAAAVTEDGEGSEIGEVVLHRFLLETLDCQSGDLSRQSLILG